MSHLMCRLTSSGRQMSPGPAKYSTTRKAGDDSPKWTIQNRYNLKDDRVSGEYVELESTIGKVPTISMHTRHSLGKKDETPGPNYVPQPFGSDARKSTVSPRYSSKPYEASPGPGKYYPEQRPSTARYTIKGRNYMPVATSDSPGPAGYSPNYYSTIRSPRKTIGNRTDPITDKFSTPGPSAYQISRDLGGTKPSIHTKPHDLKQDITPGPSDYSVYDRSSSPKYSIGHRTDIKEDVNKAPYVNLPSTVGEGPKISLSSRRVYKNTNDTPGPNYMPEGIGHVPPIHVGNRYRARSIDQTPGPGQYDIQNTERGRSFTIKHRTNMDFGGPQSPGPAAYSPSIKQTRRSVPSPTIGIRYPEQKPKQSAGYYLLPQLNRGPQFTIGLRESCDVCIL